MARNKMSLRHPAAWTHAAIHAVCLGLALGWQAGLVLGFIYLLIDTRVPGLGGFGSSRNVPRHRTPERLRSVSTRPCTSSASPSGWRWSGIKAVAHAKSREQFPA
jgi:hypothetical protein